SIPKRLRSFLAQQSPRASRLLPIPWVPPNVRISECLIFWQMSKKAERHCCLTRMKKWHRSQPARGECEAAGRRNYPEAGRGGKGGTESSAVDGRKRKSVTA